MLRTAATASPRRLPGERTMRAKTFLRSWIAAVLLCSFPALLRAQAAATIAPSASPAAPASAAAAAASKLTPPVAAVRPHELESHGKVRNDEYYWLKERENPEVVTYLKAENDYLDKVMKPTEALQKT